MNRAREELKNLYQEPCEPITVFIYRYGQMHYLSTGIRAHRETHPFAIMGFIATLEPKLNKMVARKYADAREKPNTLEAIFQMAERCSKKMLEADSFDHSNTFRVLSTIMKFQRLKSVKFPRATGTTPGMTITKMRESICRKINITKVKRTLTRNHGKTKIKSHGARIIISNMVTRSLNPRMPVLPSLKMLSIFAPQDTIKVYLMQ